MIRETARMMARNAPATIVHPSRYVAWYGDDTQRLRSIAMLNALLGNWGSKGGFYFQRKAKVGKFPLPKYPHFEKHWYDLFEGEFPLASAAPSSGIRDLTIEGKFKVWFVYATNLIQSLPHQEKTIEAINHLDLMVLIDTMPAEITGYADVIFPECTYLERYDDLRITSGKKAQIALRAPATKPPSGILSLILSLGMGALFFDLEFKLHVFRFYTAFQIFSPMSWGSWTLMLFYPFSILLTLATLEDGWPSLYKYVENISIAQTVIEFSKKHIRLIAKLAFPVAVFLGIYTGILLSAYVGRPLWNSAILGPIFLVSGLSTALALVLLLSKDKNELRYISTMDLVTIIIELVLVILYLYNLGTSTTHTLEASKLFLGGAYSTQFWVFFVGIGLVTPLLLEVMELRGRDVDIKTRRIC